MKRLALLPALFLLCANLAFSLDFGFLLDEKFELEDKLITSTTGLTPWFSWDGGNGISVYLSGLVSLRYIKSDDGIDDNDGLGKPVVLPELSRFALSYRINQNMSLEAGRVSYTDVLGVTASGLFDGARFEADMGAGSLKAGLFYTGLLYKETAKILMTPSDTLNYGDPRNMENIVDEYFASRRFFASARWDMPLGDANNFSFEALAQFDLNGEEDKLNSQYGELQVELFTGSKVGFTAGAFFEAMEYKVMKEDEFGIAFGGLGVLRIDLPTPINDALKFSAKYSSGYMDSDTITAFIPMSAHAQGQIFPEIFSGLGIAKLNYEARIVQSLFAEATFSYFVQTNSIKDESGDSDKYLYGGEAWASLSWQPLDDIRVNLGGGIFLPSLGNITPDADAAWKVSAGLSLSF
ncbi:MAG: hypothetical protein LBI04_12520 [Treponema sp.]|jgi:hypothetical protein|nr:hypothetical protein [Treponema sp.]